MLQIFSRKGTTFNFYSSFKIKSRKKMSSSFPLKRPFIKQWLDLESINLAIYKYISINVGNRVREIKGRGWHHILTELNKERKGQFHEKSASILRTKILNGWERYRAQRKRSFLLFHNTRMSSYQYVKRKRAREIERKRQIEETVNLVRNGKMIAKKTQNN